MNQKDFHEFVKFSITQARPLAKICNSNSKSENLTYDPAILVRRFANFFNDEAFQAIKGSNKFKLSN